MSEESMGRGLGPGPTLLYPLKAALTRAGSIVWLVGARKPAQGIGVRILFYHRVADDRDELAVTPERFGQQMEALAREGFEVVGVPEVASRLRAGSAGPKLLGLSFDDGYRDVVEHGLPALERHGFGATVYVATRVIDGTEHFAWYERQPELLRWDEIVELDRAGTLGFEAHTLTHPNLLDLGDDACRAEIAGSKSELEARLGRTVTSFCYPAGLFGARERRYVEEAGFLSGASCEPGVNRADTDPLGLRRRQIDARDRLLDFRAKVGGGHDSPPPLRRAWRRLRYGASSSRS